MTKDAAKISEYYERVTEKTDDPLLGNLVNDIVNILTDVEEFKGDAMYLYSTDKPCIAAAIFRDMYHCATVGDVSDADQKYSFLYFKKVFDDIFNRSSIGSDDTYNALCIRYVAKKSMRMVSKELCITQSMTKTLIRNGLSKIRSLYSKILLLETDTMMQYSIGTTSPSIFGFSPRLYSSLCRSGYTTVDSILTLALENKLYDTCTDIKRIPGVGIRYQTEIMDKIELALCDNEVLMLRYNQLFDDAFNSK